MTSGWNVDCLGHGDCEVNDVDCYGLRETMILITRMHVLLIVLCVYLKFQTSVLRMIHGHTGSSNRS